MIRFPGRGVTHREMLRLLAMTDDAIVFASDIGRIRWMNDAMVRLLHGSQPLDKWPTSSIRWDVSDGSPGSPPTRRSGHSVSDPFAAAFDGRCVTNRRYHVQVDDAPGSVVTVTTARLPRFGRAPIVIMRVRDDTERVLRELSLLRDALHDPLTGLPNRRALRARFAQGVRDDPSRFAAVMALDLDDFKKCNDTHGHAVGDQVLMIVASRLRSTLRELNVLARVGGDEFIAVCDVDSEAEAEGIAARLADAVRSPIRIADILVHVSISIGVAVDGLASESSGSPDALLARADAALYRAKELGRNLVVMAT